MAAIFGVLMRRSVPFAILSMNTPRVNEVAEINKSAAESVQLTKELEVEIAKKLEAYNNGKEELAEAIYPPHLRVQLSAL